MCSEMAALIKEGKNWNTVDLQYSLVIHSHTAVGLFSVFYRYDGYVRDYINVPAMLIFVTLLVDTSSKPRYKVSDFRTVLYTCTN